MAEDIRPEDMELEEIRQALVELAETLPYEGTAEAEVLEPAEDGELDYDPRPLGGMLVKAPLGFTFAIKLNETAGSDKNIELFNGTSLPSGVSETPSGKNAEIYNFARSNPIGISGFRVSASDSATLEQLIFTIERKTPFGSVSSNQISALDFKTEGDFQSTMVSIPVGFTLDGFTSVKFTLPANKSVAFTFFVERIKDNAAPIRAVRPALPTKHGLVRTPVLVPRRRYRILPVRRSGGLGLAK